MKIFTFKNKKPFDIFLLLLVIISALITFCVLIFLIIYIVYNGLPYLKPSLFSLKYNSENVSLMPAVVTTFIMTGISLLISLPLGIFTAIYLTEYAKSKNKVVVFVRLTAETLSGIPSIIYGLFGMIFFVTYLNLKLSILSGSLTLAIMILPLVMRTTEEALRSVPVSYREGSFGLGAGKLRTIFRIVIPSAVPGILAGVILATGRIVGETAALIYTAGTVPQIPKNMFESGRTLAIHMWALSGEGLHTKEAYATALVLLIFIVFVNMLSDLVAKRFTKG